MSTPPFWTTPTGRSKQVASFPRRSTSTPLNEKFDDIRSNVDHCWLACRLLLNCFWVRTCTATTKPIVADARVLVPAAVHDLQKENNGEQGEEEEGECEEHERRSWFTSLLISLFILFAEIVIVIIIIVFLVFIFSPITSAAISWGALCFPSRYLTTNILIEVPFLVLAPVLFSRFDTTKISSRFTKVWINATRPQVIIYKPTILVTPTGPTSSPSMLV